MLLWLAEKQDKVFYSGNVILSDPNTTIPMLADSYESYGYIYVSY